MSNKENSQATIAELMARQSRNDNDSPVLFKKPEVIKNNTATTDGEKEVVEIKEVLRQQNMLVSGSALGPEYYDEYRRIKRPLLSNAFGKTAQLVEHGNLILVTSSIPGEGKTHTSINLALSIAQERDHTVMLVDCDVTRHGTSRLLQLPDRKGIVDIIESDDLSVGDCLLKTDIPRLTILPAGSQHEYVTELLASQKMSELVREIGQRYDDRIIIFDGPPILSTPQTQIITELVGQVVFVIEAGKTPQMVVENALDLIPEEKATGIVMNKSEGLSGRSGYYYGYYGRVEK